MSGPSGDSVTVLPVVTVVVSPAPISPAGDLFLSVEEAVIVFLLINGGRQQSDWRRDVVN